LLNGNSALLLVSFAVLPVFIGKKFPMMQPVGGQRIVRRQVKPPIAAEGWDGNAISFAEYSEP
jgi:hypothetical protein